MSELPPSGGGEGEVSGEGVAAPSQCMTNAADVSQPPLPDQPSTLQPLRTASAGTILTNMARDGLTHDTGAAGDLAHPQPAAATPKDTSLPEPVSARRGGREKKLPSKFKDAVDEKAEKEKAKATPKASKQAKKGVQQLTLPHARPGLGMNAGGRGGGRIKGAAPRARGVEQLLPTASPVAIERTRSAWDDALAEETRRAALAAADAATNAVLGDQQDDDDDATEDEAEPLQKRARSEEGAGGGRGRGRGRGRVGGRGRGRGRGGKGGAAESPGDAAAKSQPPVAPATRELLPYEVVWAKLPSFPWWPAQVQNTPEGVAEKPGKVFVVFYGDQNVAWVPRKNVTPFDVDYDARAANGSRGLQKALGAAWTAVGGTAPPASGDGEQ
uniref:PWWP domain-containing protein n=1 Tax=Pycnococcus provasolii TaxID=41880 RepID=A0A7S2YUI0_9CHLO|mmetsp:Transcript_106/g.313  ORF Transcript_106/g.313 Transcript_106/m.313 type:complete len:385 (+) Transcript_106:76-1230(+)